MPNKTFAEISKLIEPSKKPVGKIVLAMTKGEVHDIGKSVIKGLFQYHHFEVIDLGAVDEPQAILEAIDLCEKITGKNMSYEISDQHRSGDHIWYITSLEKFRNHFTNWKICYNLEETVKEIYSNNIKRWGNNS